MASERSTAEPRAYVSSVGRLRMLAGDPALDFANTLHWRGGREVDFLPDYRSLVGWSGPAGLLSEDEMRLLADLAPTVPKGAAAAHAAAVALRSAWRDSLSARTGGDPMLSRRKGSDSGLERLLASALADPRLLISANAPADGHPAQVLSLPVARVALAIASLTLIPGDRKLGRCEGDPCGGFFLNTSRSKPRRWCAMDSCGNRAKARGFRSRLVAEAVDAPDR